MTPSKKQEKEKIKDESEHIVPLSRTDERAALTYCKCKSKSKEFCSCTITRPVCNSIATIDELEKKSKEIGRVIDYLNLYPCVKAKGISADVKKGAKEYKDLILAFRGYSSFLKKVKKEMDKELVARIKG